MLACFTATAEQKTTSIIPVLTETFESWLSTQSTKEQEWMRANGFKASSGTFCLMPDEQGELASIFLGVESNDDVWAIGSLANKLEAGLFSLNDQAGIFSDEHTLDSVYLAWALGTYRFTRYQTKQPTKTAPQLLLPAHLNAKRLSNHAEAVYFIRDLINTPMEDMGPGALVSVADDLAKRFGAKLNTIVGDSLLEAGFPMVHAVGRASSQAPRLIDLRWGSSTAPQLTLVGKGVCFDTGGINLKPNAGMRFMKKDMAGAAHVLALAQMIMTEQLPVYLRVLIPVVDNAVSGNCIRPGDVITTRPGLSVEITNTDAEGRLILGDALAEAVLEKPDCLIDFATLTGPYAIGPELPSLFSNNESWAESILQASAAVDDPLWRMPLHPSYRRHLKSAVADIVNSTSVGYAGSITAALYLQHFVPDDIPWIHFDMTAWNQDARPARPVGGEACALRAVFHCIENRYR